MYVVLFNCMMIC